MKVSQEKGWDTINRKPGPEGVVREIKRRTRKKYSTEEKIRIVLEGLKGEASIAELCRREGISPKLYYTWSKEFLEAGKKRLQGDTEREASTGREASMSGTPVMSATGTTAWPFASRRRRGSGTESRIKSANRW